MSCALYLFLVLNTDRWAVDNLGGGGASRSWLPVHHSEMNLLFCIFLYDVDMCCLTRK